MSKDKASKAFDPSANAPGVVVTELNNFDVLLGRGMPILKQTGNNRFRALIANHRDEYRAINRHTHKDEIARRIMLTIRALGGRFLRAIESTKDRAIYKIGADVQAWVIVDEETSLQKVKQALRELPWNAEAAKKRKQARRSLDSLSTHSAGSQLQGEQFDQASQDAMYQQILLENRLRLLQQSSTQTVFENQGIGDAEISMQRRRSIGWAQLGGLPQPHFNTAPLPSIMEESANMAMLLHTERRGSSIQRFGSMQHRDSAIDASLGTLGKQGSFVARKASPPSSGDDDAKPKAKSSRPPDTGTSSDPRFGP